MINYYDKKALIAVKMYQKGSIKKKSQSSKKKPTKANYNQLQLRSILNLNENYSNLMKNLSEDIYLSDKMQYGSFLTSAFQNLKKLNQNLKQQNKIYKKYANSEIQEFIQEQELGNVQNMISKNEEINYEIEICEKDIKQLETNINVDNLLTEKQQQIFKNYQQLQKIELKQIKQKNKNDKIKYQLNKGNYQLNNLMSQNIEHEIKLRKFQKSIL